MYEENSDVKQRLIEIGRKEFLEHGYLKASMRNISSAANVTTGAIYFFFHNKEEFFRAILDETATEWKKHLQDYSESERQADLDDIERINKELDLLKENVSDEKIIVTGNSVIDALYWVNQP